MDTPQWNECIIRVCRVIPGTRLRSARCPVGVGCYRSGGGGREAAMKTAARVRLFTRATSLGGPHSLIEHRASVEGPGTKTPQNLLRVSIGLEHADDLIADLQQALS